MDRFQELSKIALDELSEVFARMSDENVREHIGGNQESGSHFSAWSRERGTFDERVCNAADAFGGRNLIGYGMIPPRRWAKAICSSAHAEVQTWHMKIHFVTMQRKPAQRLF